MRDFQLHCSGGTSVKKASGSSSHQRPSRGMTTKSFPWAFDVNLRVKATAYSASMEVAYASPPGAPHPSYARKLPGGTSTREGLAELV